LRGNLEAYLGREIPEFPSVDTISYYLRGLHPSALQSVVDSMISELSRKKVLDALKTEDKLLLLAIDGVHLHSSDRPLEHSTSRTHEDGSATWRHYCLEAKIVSPEGLALSVHSEMIENPEGVFDKQDCELKAFKRLADAAARKHPHMRFLVLLDSLYCNEPVISLCRAHGWQYCVTFKGERQNRPLMDEFTEEINAHRENRKTVSARRKSGAELRIQLRWCNGASHVFNRTTLLEGLNYIEGVVTRVSAGGAEKTFKMAYVTSMKINASNALEVFNTCRQRWKIENQGFNFQKNHGLGIGHSFCSLGNAAHNYYLLAQIAHIVLQLTCLTDIVKHWRKKQPLPDGPGAGSLLQLFGTFKIILNRIRMELMNMPLTLYEFSDLRIRMPGG
jgi:hypothetical protein